MFLRDTQVKLYKNQSVRTSQWGKQRALKHTVNKLGTYTLLSVRDRVSASLDRLCCSLSLALVAGARA